MPSKANTQSDLQKSFSNMTLGRGTGAVANSMATPSGAKSAVAPTAMNRMRTSKHNLGDNTRSYIEGMIPKSTVKLPPTNLGTGTMKASNAAPSNPNASMAFTAKTGSALPSIFKTQADSKMAAQQTRISTLAPSQQTAQNTWAQRMISRTASCPENYAWDRIRGGDGYQCKGGFHVITDTLLSEGNGGVLVLLRPSNPMDLNSRFGPYYPDPNMAGRFIYCGPDPRPPLVPEYLGNDNAGRFAAVGSAPGSRATALASARQSQQAASQRAGSQNMQSILQSSRPMGTQRGGSQLAGTQYGGTQPGGSKVLGTLYGGTQARASQFKGSRRTGI